MTDVESHAPGTAADAAPGTAADAAADAVFTVPASYAQERVWFTAQLSAGRPLFNVMDGIALPAGADAGVARAALELVVARHETLRTALRLADGQLLQDVHPTVPVELAVTDLGDLPEAERQRRRAEVIAELTGLDLPMDQLPLWRARLLRLAAGAPGTWELMVVAHHAVVDGTALLNLRAEIVEACAALVAGRPPELPELAVQYADFSVWEREQLETGRLAELLDHWRGVLAGMPPVHALPTDRPRPAVRAFAGADARRSLPDEALAALPALTREASASPVMVLLAAFAATLHRLGAGDDIVVGLPVAGRERPELQPLLGMFVNMLVLRIDVSGDPSFLELVRRVRQALLDAWEHQDMPFQKLVEALAPRREPGVPPLYQITFNYLPTGRGEAFGVAADDLALEVAGGEVRLEHDTALFDAGTAERMVDRYVRLLAAAVAEPATRVGDLPVLDPAEREQVVAGWNATDVPLPATTLAELLAEQATRTPSAVAVDDGATSLTYAQLDAAADAVAQELVRHGAGPETVVAVHAPRSTRLVVALLGVLKAGAAYLPLDPDYPAQRLAFMLADAGAALVLADELPAGIDVPGTVLPLTGGGGTGERRPVRPATPGNAAYVIYTSGSTGRPKGVVNAHAGIVNRLDWMQRAFSLGPDDVVLHKTPIGFDVSVWELFWPLITGARLVLARPGGHRDPDHLRELIERHAVTTVHFVPSMLEAFLATAGSPGSAGLAGCRTLRRIVCSGEELPLDLARRCASLLPGAALHNLYGPTEAAVDVTAWACTPAALAGVSRVPIGGPISGVRTYVLDRALRPVPIGVAGQLHLGGVQVARGYHGRPALTAERFLPDPFGPPGGRLYATGDLARWRPDGTLEFLGRADDQVKLRGLRIEPGEIAAVLREQPGVRAAAVVVRGASPGDRRLVAYLVPDGAAPDGASPDGVDLTTIREALRRRLPEHMVPAAFVTLDALPLSPNGKLDHDALPEPARAAPGTGEAPQTPTQQAIAAVWQEVLRLPAVGLDDDFFDLGGHSLLAIRVLARLRDAAAITGVGVMDLFQHPTVRRFAELVDGPGPGDRPLLYELTRPVEPAQRVCSYVCVPYGGGLASVFQPLADAMPRGHALWSVAIPGHDVGAGDEELSFDELAERCAAEIMDRVDGPLVLYGHCVGGALLAGIARRLAALGRPIDAIYAGGAFPVARPGGILGRLVDWVDERGADRGYENFLRSIGAELADLDPEQVDRFVRNVRQEAGTGAEMFTRWLDPKEQLEVAAPVISVVGSHDVLTEYYEERYREWRFLGSTVALVVLDEAGHYFVKHRAQALAEIITRVHRHLDDERPPEEATSGSGWRLAAVGGEPEQGSDVQPGVRRFLTVAAGQLISLTGSALTQWAVPVWVYLTTGSLLWFGLSGVIAYLPALLALPVAGAVADRFDRRRVLMAACVAAPSVEVVLVLLLWTGHRGLVPVYLLVSVLGAVSVFQRITYLAAIPQVMPKRYLGHANGIAQMTNGLSALTVPLLAAGLLAAIGLAGILMVDIVSYAFALAVLAAVRFPRLLGRVRREPFLAELVGGVRMSWADRGFRAMLVFFALYNLCLATLLLVPPLVLAFGTMADVGRVAFAEAAGTVLGGLVIAVWGGPTRRRMPAIIGIAFGVAASLVLSGLRPDLVLVTAGSFGVGLGLGLHNGIYLSIIQVKVPQRYHGRVLATIQTLTWATLPLGFAVLVPASGAVLEPMLAPGGALAGTVGAVIGTGPGRGLGFAMVVAGVALALVSLAALRVRRLRRLDIETPDAPPDGVPWSPGDGRDRVADLQA
ncbi:MAG: amino acid adenylation domain-containing protein [Frankiaceae bacterium]